MSDNDVVLGEKCGNCKFAIRVSDGQSFECHGEPPRVVPMAGGADALGRPVIQLQMFRPRVEKMTHACHLWKVRPMVFDAAQFAQRVSGQN